MVLRIYDANLDRIGEGLRVLEEVARFLLDDPSLTQKLKGLRHELVGSRWALERQLLAARRSEEDVGAFVETPSEGQRADVPAIVTANMRRVQESLRVLEEFGKLPEGTLGIDSAKLKQARFAMYSIEQRLISRLLRQEKGEKIRGLYLIIDSEALAGRSEAQVARQAMKGGAQVIQLRDKRRSRGELFPIAQELKKICAEAGVLFIVNDYLDLALAADADGVHVGQGDLPVKAVRRILPIDKIAGCSAATLEEAVRAQADGADYIAVGSIYPTPSKQDTRLAGLETLRQVKGAVSVPLVAIGGINKDNVAQVMQAGADCVAIISAVLGAENVEGAARQLATKLKINKN